MRKLAPRSSRSAFRTPHSSSSNKLHLPLLAALFALVMPGRADDCWIFTLKEGQTKNGTVTCGPWTFDAYTTGTTAANGAAGLKVGGQQTEVYDVSKETLAEPTIDFSLPVYDADGARYAFTAYGDSANRFRFTTVNKTNIKHVVWSQYATTIPGPFQTLGGAVTPTLKTITCHSDVLEQINSIAFERCANLVHFDVRAPNLKRVMDGAFSGSGLTNNIHDILASDAENAQGFRNSKVCGDALFTNLTVNPGSFASTRLSSLTIVSRNPALTAGPSVYEIGATFTNLCVDMCNLTTYAARTIGHRYSTAATNFRTMYIGSSNVVNFAADGTEGPLWGCANLNSFTFEGPFPGEESLNHLFFMNTTYNDGTVHTIPRIIYCSKYLGWGDYVAETPLAQLTPEDKATRGQPNGCPPKCFGVFVRTKNRQGKDISSRHAWLVHRESKWRSDPGGLILYLR